MKKFLALVLLLGMIFTLASCGTANAGSAPTSQDKVFKMAFIAKYATSNWGQRQGKGVAQFRQQFGHDVVYDAPEAFGDSAAQISLVESYIAQGVDAIIVVPIDVVAIEPAFKRARDASIVVITHEAAMCENIDYDVEAVTAENFGRRGLSLITEQLGDRKGTYVYFVGTFTNGAHNQFGDAAEAYAREHHPNLTVAPRVESGESIDGAYARTVELIKTYPDLVAIQGSSASDLPGASNAVEEAGLSGRIVLGGVAIPSQVSPYLESGTLKHGITWDPQNSAFACCVAAMKVLQGETISTGTSLGPSYESVTVNGRVIVGNDINVVDIDNWTTFGF